MRVSAISSGLVQRVCRNFEGPTHSAHATHASPRAADRTPHGRVAATRTKFSDLLSQKATQARASGATGEAEANGAAAATEPAHAAHGGPAGTVKAQLTRPNPGELETELMQSWPGLTREGARTLAAQSGLETGDFGHCYNWNFGNVKASASEPHMYLDHVWEGMTPEAFAKAKAGPLGHLVHADTAGPGAHPVDENHVRVIFDAPHPQCRFRAYSREQGVDAFASTMKAHAAKDPAFLDALNAGDAKGVAHILKRHRYYTGSESAYAAGIALRLRRSAAPTSMLRA